MVYILFTDRTDFNARKVIRYNEGHYLIIEGLVVQEDLTILNVYKPHKKISNYVRQKPKRIMKRMDESTIIVETSTPLCQKWTHTTLKKSVRKRVTLNNMNSQLDRIQIYRLHYPTQQKKHSSQANIKYLPRKRTFWATKHTLTNLE